MNGLNFPAAGAIYFDGLSITFPATWGCWFSPNVTPTGNTTLMSVTTPTGDASLMGMSVGPDNNSRYGIKLGNATASQSRSLGTIPALNAWTLFMCIWASATDFRVHDLLRDPATSDMTTLDMTGVTFTRLCLGDRINTGGLRWRLNGQMADPFVYNRAFSRADLEFMANQKMSPMDMYESNLKLHIPNLMNFVPGAPKNWYGGQAPSLFETAPIVGTVSPIVNFPEFA